MNWSKWTGTWASVADALKTAGIDPAVIETVRRATAWQRHKERTQAAYNAARRWLKENRHFTDEVSLDAHARALCFAEAKGLYGGGKTNPGAGTTRHPAFDRLGRGRRHAIDGPAWTAAIAAAAAESGCTLSVDPIDKRLAIYLINMEGNKTFVPVRALFYDHLEARWNIALHAAQQGWSIGWTELIVASAQEIAEVENENKVYQDETD